LQYIKKVSGDKTVPLCVNRALRYGEGFNQPHATANIIDYPDLLESKPANFRIFLNNILKEVPVLQAEFKFPELGMRLIKGLR
jgi:hypothetical protein